jgi:hypothetical protein
MTTTLAYRQKAEQFLRDRAIAYQNTFLLASPATRTVLQDLSAFCRAGESTFHPDARVHALMEGRREVFLRITQHLHMTTEQLWHVYGNPAKLQKE